VIASGDPPFHIGGRSCSMEPLYPLVIVRQRSPLLRLPSAFGGRWCLVNSKRPEMPGELQKNTMSPANAHAALRWLSNERPNFDEARAALKAIVSAGHRAGEIARSLHSTFKKESQRDL